MLCGSAWADDSTTPTMQLHPQKTVVDGVEGVFFPTAEARYLLIKLQQANKVDSIEKLEAQALVLSQMSVRSSSTAYSLEHQALAGTEAMLAQCQSALKSETDRCESFWRQPGVALLGGAVAASAMCIGLSHGIK